MSLNIKDPKAHALARRLASVTGESMTRAVRIALEERLRRESRRQHGAVKAEELLAIGKRCAQRLKGRIRSHGDLLYDEDGMPR
jgi:antitoxin VapB